MELRLEGKVLDAMREQPDSALMQECGCGTLYKLCTTPRYLSG